MDTTVISMAFIGSSAGAWFVTSGILIALKSALGNYWGDLANRLTTLLLPVILVEASIAATGEVKWPVYFVGIFAGLLASQGAKTAQANYNEKVLEKAKSVELKKK